MKAKYKTGDIVYFSEYGGNVEEATVVMTIAGFVTIRFTQHDSGTRVRENRLFPTRDEAERDAQLRREEDNLGILKS
ncbi:MAG: hypothetical protein IJI14_20780 [Anaerolineaceae bacterium]|nr:hypothetical protein [Anaerolineaceae bacterium]